MTSGQKTFLAIITSLCPQVNTSRPSLVLKVEEAILVGKSLDKASSLDHYRLVDVDHLRLVASPPSSGRIWKHSSRVLRLLRQPLHSWYNIVRKSDSNQEIPILLSHHHCDTWSSPFWSILESRLVSRPIQHQSAFNFRPTTLPSHPTHPPQDGGPTINTVLRSLALFRWDPQARM